MVLKNRPLILVKFVYLRAFPPFVLFPINLAFAAELMRAMLADCLLCCFPVSLGWLGAQRVWAVDHRLVQTDFKVSLKSLILLKLNLG